MCLYVQENVQINQILVTRGADRQRNIDLVDHHSPGKSQMPKKMPHGFSFQCLHCFLRVWSLLHGDVGIITVTVVRGGEGALYGLTVAIFQRTVSWELWAWRLNPCTGFTVGTEEGPVAGGDGLVVLANGHGNGAGEDVQGELFYPLVPVALVELGAVWNEN